MQNDQKKPSSLLEPTRPNTFLLLFLIDYNVLLQDPRLAVRVDPGGAGIQLVVHNLMKSDGGQYTCAGTNSTLLKV